MIALGLIAAAAIGFAGPAGRPARDFPPPSRPVASVVSPRWSTEDAREHVGEAAKVIGLLGPLDGKTVADIGAGDGYYEARLARAVGPKGRVIAQDIDAATLADLSKRVARLGNVTVALGEGHDPRLPRGAVDVALMVHMYHEITQPYALLANLRASLRAGGRVAIVDADRPTNQHGTPPKLLACELAAAGYARTSTAMIEDGIYLAVFTPGPAPAKIAPCK